MSKPLSSSPEKGHHRSNDSSLDLVIVHGEPVTFKKSTFQAHVTSVTSLAEVGKERSEVDLDACSVSFICECINYSGTSLLQGYLWDQPFCPL